ncbi:MAG TPA: hypothetical protein VHO29_18445 [Marmoricola sp.]|nr:hypothetical protein [Marmoricola sp.]
MTEPPSGSDTTDFNVGVKDVDQPAVEVFDDVPGVWIALPGVFGGRL